MTWVVAAGLFSLLLGFTPVVGRQVRAHRVEQWRGMHVGRAEERGRRRPRNGGGRGGRASSRPLSERREDDIPLSMLVTEVSARLRAGAVPREAWALSWERHPGLGSLGQGEEDGVPRGVVALSRRPRWSQLWGRGNTTGWTRPTVGEVWRAGRAPEVAQRAAARALVCSCRFTTHLGAPLADVLDLVADGIDGAAGAEDARRVAGSGPRTSTRVLLVLPLLGLFLGEVLDAAPVAFLFGGGTGTLCLVVGVGCQIAGHVVSRAMTRRAEGAGRGSRVDPAILCDLGVAGLESGASVPSTLEALGAAAEMPELGRIARELLLGVPWRTAWNPHPPDAGPLGEALEPAWSDGTAPVPLLRRAAARVRSRRLALASQEAERLAVRLVVPVAALLLPAFVALGVVPVLVHLATTGLAPGG